MSCKQTARKRSASERAPLERRDEPAPLCNFASTAVAPVPHEMGMRTSANAGCWRHDAATICISPKEAMAA